MRARIPNFNDLCATRARGMSPFVRGCLKFRPFALRDREECLPACADSLFTDLRATRARGMFPCVRRRP